jgi:hypothetical protein
VLGKLTEGSLFRFERELRPSFAAFSLKFGSEVRSKSPGSCFLPTSEASWMAFGSLVPEVLTGMRIVGKAFGF